MTEFFILLAAFEVKHFLCDYPLQPTSLAVAKGRETGWVTPLALHAWIHGLGTLLVVYWWSLFTGARYPLGFFAALAVFDYATHFWIDRVKASKRLLGRYTFPSEKYFYAFGADQAAHHLVMYVIAYWLITGPQ